MVSNKLSLANLNNLIDISKFFIDKNIISSQKPWHINAQKPWHNNAKKSHALTTCDFIIIE